jgi:transposase
MRRFVDAHPDWLTQARLPAYAPDLNAVEGPWANMKNGLGNLAATAADQLTVIIKNRLKSIQYRPALIEAFLTQTGLTLQPGLP